MYDIIIQAGQSNSEGCGINVGGKGFKQNESIMYLTKDLKLSAAKEAEGLAGKINNFSLSFAAKYFEEGRLSKDRKLLILRCAVGGTGFLDKRWGMTDDLYLKMMEMIRFSLSLSKDCKLKAFLWHQGETDAMLNASRDTHYNNLRTLIESVKKEYNVPNLPFVAGDFVYDWKKNNLKICEPVITAIKDVCADIGNASFVETSDLSSNNQILNNGDAIHFSFDALTELGQRYFDAYCKIAK